MVGAEIYMASHKESAIEQKACDLIWKNLGLKGYKLQAKGVRAFPDRAWFLPGGLLFMIEFKRPGEEPRPNQLEMIKYLKKQGFIVEVHDDAIDAFQAIIKALETTQLPEGGEEILARARKRCAILRPRTG